jgi:hypothetical protein
MPNSTNAPASSAELMVMGVTEGSIFRVHGSVALTTSEVMGVTAVSVRVCEERWNT